MYRVPGMNQRSLHRHQVPSANPQRHRLERQLRDAREALASKPTDAYLHAQEAARLAEGLEDRLGRAAALFIAGRAATLAARYEDALPALHQALALYETEADHHGAANSLTAIGEIYEALSDAGGALAHFRQAAALEEETGDRIGRVRTLQRISRLLIGAGDPAAALDAARLALGSCCESGRVAERTLALIATGDALRAQGRLVESEAALEEAVSLLREAGNDQRSVFAEALAALAATLRDQGHLARAEAAWVEARDRAQGIEVAGILGRAWLGLAGAAIERDDETAVRQAIAQALDQAARDGDLRLKLECHRALAAWHRHRGDPESALAAMDEAEAVRIRVCLQESRNRLRAAELQRRASVDGLVDHAEIRAAALVKAYAELETLNASLRAADTAKTELLARLERKTFEDALTGLHNRRYAELRVAEEFQRAVRHQRPLSVSLIDIDDFRRINEQVSHAVADRVLKAVGEIVLGSVRTIDIVARYGSDEFLVIFPDTTENGAAHACDNIRDAIRQYDWAAIGAPATPGIAIATVGEAGLASHERMLAAAERRLEGIKRNRSPSWRRLPG